MSRIFEIADKYVDEIAALEPALATTLGVPGHEREMPELSPEGPARNAALYKRTLDALNAAKVEGEPDRIAKEMMTERLQLAVDLYESQEFKRALRNIASPLQSVRSVFDQMPKETEEQWSNIAARLKLVPKTLAGYRQSLNEGLAQKLYASKRQAAEGAEQARIWAALAEGEGKSSFFKGLHETFKAKGLSGAVAKEMEEGTAAAISGSTHGAFSSHIRDPSGVYG